MGLDFVSMALITRNCPPQKCNNKSTGYYWGEMIKKKTKIKKMHNFFIPLVGYYWGEMIKKKD